MKIEMPFSAIEPFGPKRIMDELANNFVLNRLIEMAVDVERMSDRERRHTLTAMHPLVRDTVLTIRRQLREIQHERAEASSDSQWGYP